ncbi:MAG: methylmalonyl Co-A mutase-associated GTPase MeaB [Chlorobi bacterium]|nr:methylmalonyl Co-A mutase-associated GTPase MeaB [Chlorobiota bacterium]
MKKHILKKYKSALSVKKGVENISNINKKSVSEFKRNKRPLLSAKDYFEGIKKGDISLLSRAITVVESSKTEHQKTAKELISLCLPLSGNSVRIGVTGVPGAGKSSLIETLGLYFLRRGGKVAVLAVDPSSSKSGGSILGDKTRMEKLSAEKNAFIRPSPSGGTLGGVARKTAETIILCEAAGFDTIFVETVGVGQSEITVKSMVDFFMLVLISGAGDELQGIKRGITETADLIIINKADGDNKIKAERAKSEYANALHLFPPPESGVKPEVVTASALTGEGIPEIYDLLQNYLKYTKIDGYFFENRINQAKFRMYDTVNEILKNNFYSNEKVKEKIKEYEILIKSGKINPYEAAENLTEMYFRS